MEPVKCKHCESEDYDIMPKGRHHMAYCGSCGKFIKNQPHEQPKFYCGKYRGQLISSCTDLAYLQWYRKNIGLSPHARKAVDDRIQELTAL